MPKPAGSVGVEKAADLASRFGAFVAERYPFALAEAMDAFDAAAGDAALLRRELTTRLRARPVPPGLAETTPRVSAEARIGQAHADLIDACDGFLRRAAIEASLTAAERREILRGMLLTRATDNRLKTFFTGGDVKYGSTAFQGKGFRSLGQEAIYAAAIRLRRGAAFRDCRMAPGPATSSRR